jgi:hypothetical protein
MSSIRIKLRAPANFAQSLPSSNRFVSKIVGHCVRMGGT